MLAFTEIGIMVGYTTGIQHTGFATFISNISHTNHFVIFAIICALVFCVIMHNFCQKLLFVCYATNEHTSMSVCGC